MDTDHEANVKFVCFLMWKPHFLRTAIRWTDVYSEAWGVWATFPGSRCQDAREGGARRQCQLVLHPVISPHHSGHQTKTNRQTKCSFETPALGQRMGNVWTQYMAFGWRNLRLKVKVDPISCAKGTVLCSEMQVPQEISQGPERPHGRKRAPQDIRREVMACWINVTHTNSTNTHGDREDNFLK